MDSEVIDPVLTPQSKLFLVCLLPRNIEDIRRHMQLLRKVSLGRERFHEKRRFFWRGALGSFDIGLL